MYCCCRWPVQGWWWRSWQLLQGGVCAHDHLCHLESHEERADFAGSAREASWQRLLFDCTSDSLCRLQGIPLPCCLKCMLMYEIDWCCIRAFSWETKWPTKSRIWTRTSSLNLYAHLCQPIELWCWTCRSSLCFVEKILSQNLVLHLRQSLRITKIWCRLWRLMSTEVTLWKWRNFPPELTIHVSPIRASFRWALPFLITSDTFPVT